jgi:hypothetical protein
MSGKKPKKDQPSKPENTPQKPPEKETKDPKKKAKMQIHRFEHEGEPEKT